MTARPRADHRVGVPEEPKETKETTSRGYVVLRETSEGAWTELGIVEGSSALDAIRVLVGHRKEDEKAGRYRAVPVRSWSAPTVVKAEAKIVVSFG